MKKILIAAITFLALAGAAFAEPVFIGAGQPGKGYDKYAHKVAQNMKMSGVEAQVKNYAGSFEIAKAVCSNQVLFGPMQIDAIYSIEKSGCGLTALASYGVEKAVILFPPDSSLDELSDLGANDKILVDERGSGAELFWSTIVSIENGPDGSKNSWSKAQPSNGNYLTATGQAAEGTIKAVLMITKPDSDLLKAMVADGWSIGDLYDKDINDQQFNGKSLYEASTIDLDTQ